MDILRITLSGKSAFFKKPDVNSYYYFTYGNIFKISLLGIFGAILGYKGYNQQINDNSVYPEFYEKLKNIKVGIEPKNNKGHISKKIQVFNNSVGYASKEQGGNLIIKEQWLENPKWNIYLLINGCEEEKIKKRILNSNFKYIPYLGKNDHFANISDVKIIKNSKKIDEVNKIDSLFFADCFSFQKAEEDIYDLDQESLEIFKYEELLPISLEETTNKYELKNFIYTNINLKLIKKSTIYECEDKTIFFF